MLAPFKIVGFVPAKNFDIAKAFYIDVLGLEFINEDDFAIQVQAGENRVRIVKVESFEPMPFTVLGWDVDDIEKVVSGLKDRGVRFEIYPWMNTQSSSGIWDSPSGSRVAWFKDPDGNVLSISQHP